MPPFQYVENSTDEQPINPEKTESKLTLVRNELSSSRSILYDPSQFEPYNPNQLYQKKGNYTLFDKMREDDQIRSVMDFKRNLILGSGWYVDSNEQEIKDFWEISLTENFSMQSRTFSATLFEFMSFLEYGFAVAEKVWDTAILNDFGKKPYWILKDLKVRPPHSFEFHTDKFGNLEKLVQWQGLGKEIEIDKSKMLIYVHQKEFGNWYGRSEFNLGVYRAYWAKDNLIKFWNIALERFGMPTLVGTYPKNLDDASIDAFETALKNIQGKTSLIMADGCKVEDIFTSGTGEAFEKAIDKYNLMLARGLLMPDLLGLSGAQTSSGGLGGNTASSQIDLFLEMTKRIGYDLAALFTTEIIQPLTVQNFGRENYAELKFKDLTKTKEYEAAKLFLEFTKNGIKITGEQKVWIADIVGAPTGELEEQIEEEKNNPQPDPQVPLLPGQIPGQIPGKVVGQKTEKPLQDKKPDRQNAGQKGEDEEDKKEMSLRRQPNKWERKVNFIQIKNGLDELNTEYVLRIGKTIKGMIQALGDYIQEKKIIELKKIDRINDLDLKGKRSLQSDFADMLKAARDYGKSTTQAPKSNAIFDGKPALDNADVAQWLKESSVYLANEEAEMILKISKGTLMEAIRSGKSVKETMKMLEDQFAQWDNIADTGDITAPRIETIVRTNTQRVFNQARIAEFSKSSDFLAGYEYSAIMDDRTSAICEALDGKVFAPTEVDKYNPPNHYNCRSILVPVFKDEIPEDFEYSDMPPTDSEMGGFLTLKGGK